MTASGRPGRYSGGPGSLAAGVIVSVIAMSGLDLHDEVEERIGNLDELVGDAVRNREHVALRELPLLTTLDAVTADLAARDDLGIAGDDAHDVDLPLMQLRRAGRLPPARVDLVALRVEEQPALL